MMSRAFDQIREFKIESVPTNAPGSVIASCGQTSVICTAHITNKVPSWMKDKEPPSGWITADYAMLPGSTVDRKRRGTDGRSSEIQRLIARVLRGAVYMDKMPGVLVNCDCEVLKADGGTRTTAINGAYVAMVQALRFGQKSGMIPDSGVALKTQIGAISVGIVSGEVVLDLDYELDRNADVDLNIAMTSQNRFIEIQGTGEQTDFSREQLNKMLDLAGKGISEIHQKQNFFLESINN